MLIERTPGDVYITIMALWFVCWSVKNREFDWLKFFWVRAVFAFWGVCLLSAVLSPEPIYSLGEAFIWVRFPLFAMATVFWLGKDMRLLYLMLISTAIALLCMGGILSIEIAVEGFKPRLSWPYDDLVPGNYLAKVGLPIVVFSSALFLSKKGLKSFLVCGYLVFVIGMTLMTGERINFLILFCASLLTMLTWESSWYKRAAFMTLVAVGLTFLFVTFPDLYDRFVVKFLNELPFYEGSPYFEAMAPAWLIFKKFPLLGIGPGNFRDLCADFINPSLGYPCHNHPHNFYLQVLSEVGLAGFLSLLVLVMAVILKCFSSRGVQKHVIISTAWIIPFALFWPIRSSADFFGQWNNVFMWSAIALAIAVSAHSRAADD